MDKIEYIFLLCALFALGCYGSHFRGGTISWKPIGNQNKVEFKFKMAWSYGQGPGCNENKTGQYVQDNFVGDKSWMCVNGCLTHLPVGPAFYYCTDASKDGDWEQGENTFEYTFSGKGPFIISYVGAMWMTLSVKFSDYNGRWNLQTTVNLEERSDTGLPNSSPLTASKPLYILQFNCEHELQIPMVDPDGDTVKCRWAENKECDSICHTLPNAVLVEETCTLKFNADVVNYVVNGWYALALTIEDFAKSPITIGNSSYNTSTPMSTVPVQFLVHTVTKPLGCKQKPIFVKPTPEERSHISVLAGNSIRTQIYASNAMNPTANVTAISVTCPPGMTHTGPFSDSSRPGVVYWELQWTPIQSQKGDNIFCGSAEDNSGQRSDSYCFSFIAWDIDPCASLPCRNNGTCNRKGSTSHFECFCPGYNGTLCETEIDECVSHPCLNGGSCHDHVNGYHCSCPSEFTGKECQTDIDPCANLPCHNNGTCNRKGSTSHFECFCPGYNGTLCETEIDECVSHPCLNGGSCHDNVNGYHCSCPSNFTGKDCQTGISEKNDDCPGGYISTGSSGCLSIGVILAICAVAIGASVVCLILMYRFKKRKNEKVGTESNGQQQNIPPVSEKMPIR